MAMTEDQLKALTDMEIQQALGYSSSELTKQRQKALEYYYAKPVGDLAPSSIDGRSSVVATDVLDTVEWMLPSLLKMFASGDKVVEFVAKSEAYEEQAEHVTEYIGNHVFHVQNTGFQVLQTWFKDALLSKNGIVKVWWDIRQDEAREEYNGLSDIELSILLDDQHVEPIEHSAILDESTGAQLHNIAVKRVVDKGFCRIENVPPEEFIISKRAKTCDDSPFVGHRFQRSIGQLKESGYKNIDALSSDDAVIDSSETTTRNIYDNTQVNNDGDNGDPSSRIVWVTECYLKVDYDGDGIPEYRKVVRAGNQILENVEVDGQPFVSLCPVPIPHQFFGLSIADLAMESQRTKTSLMRAMIDNLYLSVNGRTWALEGQVNLDDLLTSRPGGVVRVKQAGAVGSIQAGAGDLQGAMAMMDYVDQARENRTGFTRYSQGGDADALNQTATGMNIITNRADSRIELIARNFAETGVRQLFLKMLELVSKYQDKAERIKATKGWIDIDPREWKNQFNLTVNVGLGTGNKEQITQKLNTLWQAMQSAAQAGVVQPVNIYKAGLKLAETLGFPEPELFFTDPSQLPPKQQQEDPQTFTAKAMVAIEQQKMQLEERKTVAKIAQDDRKIEADIELKRTELALKYDAKKEQMLNELIGGQVVAGQSNTGSAGGYIPPAAGGMDFRPPVV
jgi:hypothetical protein